MFSNNCNCRCGCGCTNNNNSNCGCKEPCKITPQSGCNFPQSECCGVIVPTPLVPSIREPTELCCDQNGVCKIYPTKCRNTFWPSFSHPRWLCCDDLYCSRKNK